MSGPDLLRDRRLLALAVGLPLVLYVTEIANFSLSADEELQNFQTDIPHQWLLQGRWTMAALTQIMPPIQTLPVLATVIFCVGLGVAALLLTPIFCTSRLAAAVLIVAFVANPIWPHIAQFNTLDWAVGLALVGASASVHALAERTTGSLVAGACCLAAAMGIYQPVLLMFLPFAAASVMPNGVFLSSGVLRDEAGLRRSAPGIARLAAMVAGATALYLIVTQVTSLIAQHPLAYADSYVHLDGYTGPNTLTTARTVTVQSLALLVGGSNLYLGVGVAILSPVAFGLLIAPAIRAAAQRQTFSDWVKASGVLTTCLLCSLAPLIVVAGAPVPLARTLLGFPAFCALAAANGVLDGVQARRLMLLLLSIAAASGWFVVTSLFAADQWARKADYVTATQLAERFAALGVSPTTPHPFAVVGSLAREPLGHVQRAEIFGLSMFAIDTYWRPSSPPVRAAAFLQLTGVEGLRPVPLATLAESATQLAQMPTWPAPGAVTLIGDTIVVKFSQTKP